MTFTTFTFLIFLVFVFSLYWFLKGRAQQNILLVTASYCFYSWWDYRFCALMLIASLVDFSVGLGLSRTQKSISRKALLLTSILCNFGMLGFFKYFDFFAQNFAAMLNVVGFKADLDETKMGPHVKETRKAAEAISRRIQEQLLDQR